MRRKAITLLRQKRLKVGSDVLDSSPRDSSFRFSISDQKKEKRRSKRYLTPWRKEVHCEGLRSDRATTQHTKRVERGAKLGLKRERNQRKNFGYTPLGNGSRRKKPRGGEKGKSQESHK